MGGHGVCNLISVVGANDTGITVGPDVVFDANLTEYISVAPFSATAAVVAIRTAATPSSSRVWR